MNHLFKYVLVGSCLGAFRIRRASSLSVRRFWELVFVTTKGACDPTYDFSVNITDGVITHPNLVKFRRSCDALRYSSRIHDQSEQICVRFRSALEQFRSREVEWLFRRVALLGVLDRSAKLANAFRALDGWQRCGAQRKSRVFTLLAVKRTDLTA